MRSTSQVRARRASESSIDERGRKFDNALKITYGFLALEFASLIYSMMHPASLWADGASAVFLIALFGATFHVLDSYIVYRGALSRDCGDNL